MRWPCIPPGMIPVVFLEYDVHGKILKTGVAYDAGGFMLDGFY